VNKIPAVLLTCGLLVATSMGLAACGLSKPYPAKQLYEIDLGRPQPAKDSSPRKTLRVLRVRVADPFSRREFHYLVAPNQFQQDYYANFVADPDGLLTAELTEWMFATGLYASVVDASSSVKTDVSLQCVVSQMYGDMSDAAAPKAVVSARFFLLDESDVDAKVLFSKEYRQVEPVGGAGAGKLTQAWSLAIKRILEQLTADLRSAHVPSPLPT
jgi:uncharacterized lipoprotein YmbA